MLCAPAEAPHRLVPSPVAQALRRRFVEVLVDEYQDTSRVQEAILRLVARDDGRFLVGDGKQSIYRFRQADPSLFVAKSRAFCAVDDPETGTPAEERGVRIDLTRNFRSRREVVDATNFLFRQLMDDEVGEIAYDARAELVCGAAYPPADGGDYTCELVLIDRAEGGQADAETGMATVTAQR
ncbi:UvrD-helicase domain-containing protein, partial [Calditerricola satsumensis]|uniref:UvrD-helicase domain-containing protein n=1 Tax=Calditerricola satsumensis TaxID=373054 RepID=UPI000A823401